MRSYIIIILKEKLFSIPEQTSLVNIHKKGKDVNFPVVSKLAITKLGLLC